MIDIEKRAKVRASMISGMISGAIYKSILHPIDTLKVKILVSSLAPIPEI